MLEKIKSYQPKLEYVWHALQDVRTLGALAFLVVALMITWSGIRVIETNYKLQRSISQLEQENAVRELQNRNLELENQYFESDEYLELEARKNFGLAAKGETVVVIPKEVALKHTVEPLNTDTVVEASAKEKAKQNFEVWLDFFLHRTDRD